MISETERGELIASLHNIDFDYAGQSLSPRIVRYMEDAERTEDYIVVEFRPSTRKYGRSVNGFVKYLDNNNYKEYGYGEEEIISITVMTRKKSFVGGRQLAVYWLKLIQQYIRLEWHNLTTARMIIDSFTPYIEERNFFAGRQYIYRMDFAMVSHHGWTNQPEINPIPAPEVVGVDVEDTLIWIEST